MTISPWVVVPQQNEIQVMSGPIGVLITETNTDLEEMMHDDAFRTVCIPYAYVERVVEAMRAAKREANS